MGLLRVVSRKDLPISTPRLGRKFLCHPLLFSTLYPRRMISTFQILNLLKHDGGRAYTPTHQRHVGELDMERERDHEITGLLSRVVGWLLLHQWVRRKTWETCRPPHRSAILQELGNRNMVPFMADVVEMFQLARLMVVCRKRDFPADRIEPREPLNHFAKG